MHVALVSPLNVRYTLYKSPGSKNNMLRDLFTSRLKGAWSTCQLLRLSLQKTNRILQGYIRTTVMHTVHTMSCHCSVATHSQSILYRHNDVSSGLLRNTQRSCACTLYMYIQWFKCQTQYVVYLYKYIMYYRYNTIFCSCSPLSLQSTFSICTRNQTMLLQAKEKKELQEWLDAFNPLLAGSIK